MEGLLRGEEALGVKAPKPGVQAAQVAMPETAAARSMAAGMEAPEITAAQIARLKEKACFLEGSCFYFPIRHHSPVCAWHLQRVIDTYKPDCILVEGPENANELLADLTDPETKAPFAIYYSYRDRKGLVDEGKGDFRCYYPFLDYSPELAALRAAREMGIFHAFIDLPYEEILIAAKEGKGLRRDEEKNSYNDDRYLSENLFIKGLVERSKVRGFDEFWERYFETEGLLKDTDSFLTDMFYYCVLSRANTGREELLADGCLAREAYMRERIGQARKKYARVLVVAGGFHVAGLVEDDSWLMLEEARENIWNLDTWVPESLQKSNLKNKLHKIDSKDKGVYLMSYSMEAADRLNGYASGMPYPMFYQRIWERLAKAEKEVFPDIYEQTVLQFIVEVGKEVRQKEGYPSTYDEICAMAMSRNLAMLRGKPCAGVYELSDSVLSNYVKGEYNLATDKPMRTLRRKLTGDRIGKLTDSAKLPPLCQNFENICHTFRLNVHSSTKKELTLSIFSTQRHREISSFLYRMEFLDTDFAIRKKGPNLRLRKNRNLIREIWEYQFHSKVMATLIDASVYGGTIEEACKTLAGRKLAEGTGAAAVSALIIRMFEMGLDFQSPQMIARLEELIQADSDFFELAKTFSNLSMLIDLSGLYDSGMELLSLREVLLQKLLAILIHMTGVRDEDVSKLLEAMKELYGVLLDEKHHEERAYFMDVLRKMTNAPSLHAGLAGAVHGIRYACGDMSLQEVAGRMRGYLLGSGAAGKAADYVRGLLYMARDILFVDNTILEMLDEFVRNTDYEIFLQLLPQMRLAFSYFTPMEMDRLAGKVARMYHMSGQDFSNLREVSKEVYDYGAALEAKVLRMMGT